MKNSTKSILPLATLAILLMAVSPMANASTLTMNLNPKTGLAKVDSVSTTKIVFTYPAGSMMSNYLKNVSSTFKMSGNFASTDSGVQELQGVFDHEDDHISVRSASVSIDYTAKGSATELDINKVTNVTAWVSGVFHVVNGTVRADLGWRAFIVPGAMNFNMEDRDLQYHSVDVNLVGSTMQESLASHEVAAAFLFGAFGSGSIWNRPTLNFSALNTPLSTWTKNYNAATNTTTFTKTITGQSTFSATLNYNGAKYSLSATSDPTGVVTMQGYANVQGDSLVMAPAPAAAGGLLAIGAAVAVLLGLAGYIAVKRGIKPKSPLA